MFHKFSNRLTITGQLVAETALRVGAGRSVEPVGTDLPVIKDATGRPFIPGSSLKGALRARLEGFLRAIADHRLSACIPTVRDEWCIRAGEYRTEEGRAYGRLDRIGIEDIKRAVGSDDERLTEEVWANSCRLCRTFGSPWLASHVLVRDLPVTGLWVGQYQVRDGVALDRDTGTASEGLLYDYEVVPADTAFELNIIVENAEPWQLGLLWAGLRQLRGGQIPLGGGRSRGLGAVKLKETTAQWIGPDNLLDYLGGGEGTAVQDDDERVQEWQRALRAELKAVEEEAGDAQAAD